jgi:hypothetical protein
MVSALVVVWFYLSHPRLRTHVNTMLFWRTVCDLGLALLFFVYCWMSLEAGGPAYWMSIIFELPVNATATPGEEDGRDFRWKGHYRRDQEDFERSLTLRNPRCTYLAMAYQFCTFGAELWFFCNAWDLKRAVANPFSSDVQNMRQYHALAWLGALLMAALVNVPSRTSKNNVRFDDDGEGALVSVTDNDRGHACGAWFVGGVALDHYPICFLWNDEDKAWGGRTIAPTLLFNGKLVVVAFFFFWAGDRMNLQGACASAHCRALL